MTEVAPASTAPEGAGDRPSVPNPGDARSGPRVAAVFQRLFAAVLLLAWVSLARQVLVLVGSRGLLPARESLARAAERGLGVFEVPTVFWLDASDGALVAGVGAGALLALLALAGFAPRVCFALSAPLYLSYAQVCEDFTSFQWDNMLVEVALLAAFLPVERPCRLAHFAFRLLLFKLYFESGIAKWQSHLGDWQDGSAMTYYYETAPIPTWAAWYAHHAPEWWHHVESRGALALELVMPWLIWGPRVARLAALGAFTAFQIVNTLTANYGFFTYLSAVLGVFLLGDRDIARAGAFLRARLARWLPGTPDGMRVETASPSSERRGWHARLRASAAALLVALYATASGIGALLSFSRSDVVREKLRDVYLRYDGFRAANVYHLFGHITRERIEPEFQTRSGGEWTAHDLRYKPGDSRRPPPFVAPHQPRVDFRLWFYGLEFRQGMPYFVDTLMTRMCDDPVAVEALFDAPLPKRPDAVRVAFQRYHFTTPEEHARDGTWWTREWLGALPARECAR